MIKTTVNGAVIVTSAVSIRFMLILISLNWFLHSNNIQLVSTMYSFMSTWTQELFSHILV